MPYPWQPHMHVCLFDASALFCRFTSPHTQTHTHANLSVCAPIFQASVHLWGLEGKGGARGERETGRSEREWEEVGGRGELSPTQFSLVHSLYLRSFPPFLELSKESLSPASQLRSSSVQLCRCVCVVCGVWCMCIHVYACHIYIYI